MAGQARTLLRAVELQPTNVAALHALATFMQDDFTTGAPLIRSELLGRAVRMSPRDTKLKFAYSNALGDELDYTNRNLTANKTHHHLRALHKRWLKSLLVISRTDEGAHVGTIYNNIGSAYRALGKDRLSHSYFRRAAALLQPLCDGLTSLGVLKPIGPPPPAFDAQTLRRRYFALSTEARDEVADTLHSLDTGLRYLLATQRRRRAARKPPPPI